MTTTFDAATLSAHRSAIGRTMTATEVIGAAGIERFEAAVGAGAASPLVHWSFFQDVVPDGVLGEDGHPRRGAFLPAIDALPRRMFAASSMDFVAPLAIGAAAVLTARIADVRHKEGGSGTLVFVDVDRKIEQDGRIRVAERQKLVYLATKAAGITVASEPVLAEPSRDANLWVPGSVNLFRFSAATFNGHRIHYDRRYTTEVEGYPDLIVHGPFIAARLAALAARRGSLATFEFRASAPCFVDRPIQLVEGFAGEVRAIRDDGTVSMIAKATYA